MTEAARSPAFAQRRAWLKPVAITVATTAVVAVLARLPDSVSATAVGFAFLAATYWLVLRTDDSDKIARYGLSLGGLFDPEPLAPLRIARDVGSAVLLALGAALIFLPPFWIGFVCWWHIETPSHLPRLNLLAG